MVFSYNWLKDYIKGKLPEPKKLAELLTIHSFEVSEIKKISSDFVLDIDVLPNRACDCFSHAGIARELAAVANLNYQSPTSMIREDKKLKAKDFVSVEVKNKMACPRYTSRVITDVKIGPSPKWIRERLKVCGLKPINNVVDIANYVMLETGQPLHAFDGQKLEGKKIIVRFAKNREKIVTLDDQNLDLNENILVIADAKKPVAIAGIKGGKIPEIAKSTEIVILESANFNPRIIRRGSKKLGLITDASWRFEHGISPDLTEMAINRACYLIQKIAKGKVGDEAKASSSPFTNVRVAKGLIDFYPKKALPKRIKLDLDYLEKLLGIKIPAREIKNIFKKLDFQLIYSKNKSVMVKVPTRRLDISLPEDLIEEIGRIAGFEKIKAAFPITALIPPRRNIEIFWEDMTKNILKEAGFTEVYNYSFISARDADIFNYRPKDLVEVENPISLEQKYLRPSLIPNLLKNVEKNARYIPEIKIFELGKTFKNLKTTEEKRMLTGLISTGEFRQLKGVVDLILNKLGISNIWYDDYRPTPEESKINIWHPKKCTEIKVDREEIGFLGEISPRILENLKFLGEVVVFNIDFGKLSKFASEEHEYRPISRFPAAVRDIAILAPGTVRVEEVLNKIETAGGSLVRDVDLFDIYEGEEIPRGKKNLAFHIIYQAKNKTLSSKEIDETQDKIIKALEKNPEWQVRR
jgi:phenylalanyl-tRNA synthetase beta chain